MGKEYVDVLLCLEGIDNMLCANMPGYVIFCYTVFACFAFLLSFVFMDCFCYAYVLFVSFVKGWQTVISRFSNFDGERNKE